MSRSEIRAKLEAFKWLTCKEVVSGPILACKNWNKVAGSDELWVQFARSWGIEPLMSAGDSVKNAFQKYIASLTLLAVVQPDRIWTFDCALSIFTSELAFKSESRINSYSSNIFMFDGTLICTGGGGVKTTERSVYRISLQGDILPLQPMTLPRSEHGISLFLDTIYVFGGWCVTRILPDVEKLKVTSPSTLRAAPWQCLPAMSIPRFYFNPCVHRQLVYLCGGGTDLCETFNPQIEVFTRLHWRLPNPFSHHTTVADNTSLFVLCDRFMVTYKAGKVENISAKNEHTWGTMNGVLLGSEVYLVFGRAVRVFNLAKSGCVEIRAADEASFDY